jgi:hypothetical protein
MTNAELRITHDFSFTTTQSESESGLLYDWRFTANQFVLAASPVRLTASNFILQLNTCDYSPYVTSSLTTVGSDASRVIDVSVPLFRIHVFLC